jgi:hypothetical protein
VLNFGLSELKEFCMYWPKSGDTDIESFATVWGPRLLAFFCLFGADQQQAQTLALETLAKAVVSGQSQNGAVEIGRYAIEKTGSMPWNAARSDELLVRAIGCLPRCQAEAIALSRGLGLGLEDCANVTNTSIQQAKRLFFESVLALHKQLLTQQENKLELPRDHS